MTKRPLISRWRPMRTAPKDGTFILLAYPSFSDNQTCYVGHARWVDAPHSAQIDRELREAHEAGRRPDPANLKWTAHWETAYVAGISHGGAYNGSSYEARSATIRDPWGWMPVPEPSEVMKRRARRERS